MKKMFVLFVFLFSSILFCNEKEINDESIQIKTKIEQINRISKCEIKQFIKNNDTIEIEALIQIKNNEYQTQKELNNIKDIHDSLVKIPLMLDIKILDIDDFNDVTQIHALIKLLSNTTKNNFKYLFQKKPNYIVNSLLGIWLILKSKTTSILVFRSILEGLLIRSMLKNHEDIKITNSLLFLLLTSIESIKYKGKQHYKVVYS